MKRQSFKSYIQRNTVTNLQSKGNKVMFLKISFNKKNIGKGPKLYLNWGLNINKSRFPLNLTDRNTDGWTYGRTFVFIE